MSESPLRRLLYRWLVEFNPLYLLSAALVLGGSMLISGGLAQSGNLASQLGVGAIAEAYAAALIGGAALLTRLRLRRPAVMLALLAILYQGDLTLHNETAVYLGSTGLLSSIVWSLLFVGKLYALAWAVRVRISPSAIAVATLGALGVALLPPNLAALDARHGSALVGLWVFTVFSAGLYLRHSVKSLVTLDEWGHIVLSRAVRASWAILALLMLFHVGFWTHSELVLALLVPAAPLLATRWIRSEARVWATVACTLGLVGYAAPAMFSVVAFMATGALALRAFFPPTPKPIVARVSRSGGPYRSDEAERWTTVHAQANPPSVCMRLLFGALFSGYLATWTLPWTGGPWPEHWLVLDVALTALVGFAAVRDRSWPALLPLAPVYAHWALQVGLVSLPRSAYQWGLTSVSVGFGLLTASLAASFGLRNVERSAAPPEPSGVRRDRVGER